MCVCVCVLLCSDGVMSIGTKNKISWPSSSFSKGWLHSLHTKALGKGMNPSILPPAMGKIVG